MGLLDVRQVSIMTTMNQSVTAVGTSVSQSVQVVKKKRTFDIAFLTGQEDPEERSKEEGEEERGRENLSRKSPPFPSPGLKTEIPERGRREMTPPMDDSTSTSNNSSIDVMTNGSVSDSELNLGPSQQSLTRLASLTEGNLIVASQRANTFPVTSILRQKGTTTTGSGGGRSNKSNHRGEIRFESKRTVDINQTRDSLKIKENLQFSSTLPASFSAMAPGLSDGPGESSDLVNSLPFSLLPQMGKFSVPMSLPSHFSGKGEKSESINIISYPSISSGGKVRQSQTFPDPYNLSVRIAPGAYSYPENLMLPQDLNRASAYPSHNSSHHMSAQQQALQNPAANQISSAAAAAVAAATLLPPSLTALTLPAQNICAKCNIGFRMTSDLVYHMRSHHKRDSDPLKKKREEKLKCPVCHESFRERHHLTRHMTAHQDRAEEADDKALPK